MTQTHTSSRALGWAAVHAGAEMMLLIEERPGRLPLRSVNQNDPAKIGWICADGILEHVTPPSEVNLSLRAQMDIQAIRSTAETRGLLVAEVPVNVKPFGGGNDAIVHWVLHLPRHTSGQNLISPSEVSRDRYDSGQVISTARYSRESMQTFRGALANGKASIGIYDTTDKGDSDHLNLFPHSQIGAIGPDPAQKIGWTRFAWNAVIVVAAMCVGFVALDKPIDEVEDGSYKNSLATQEAQSNDKFDENPEFKDNQGEPVLNFGHDLEGMSIEQVREKINRIGIIYQGQQTLVLDVPSRILLTQAAAKAAEFKSVGLNWKDLYGVIHAETGWVPRDGMGKNGVISSGLAQMEPETAKGLGVKDPNDDVEAVFGAARLMHSAALWSTVRVSRLQLPPAAQAERLRVGVSIYYNTSSALRRKWNGRNTHQMPTATLHHIQNTAAGKSYATTVAQEIQPSYYFLDAPANKPQVSSQIRAGQRH